MVLIKRNRKRPLLNLSPQSQFPWTFLNVNMNNTLIVLCYIDFLCLFALYSCQDQCEFHPQLPMSDDYHICVLLDLNSKV